MNYNTRVHKTYSKPVELTPVKIYHIVLHDRQIFNLSAMRYGMRYVGGSVEYLGAFTWSISTRQDSKAIDAQLRIMGVSEFTVTEINHAQS